MVLVIAAMSGSVVVDEPDAGDAGPDACTTNCDD